MGAMNLSEFGNAIRTELYCDDTVHVPAVINRAVAKTEALLARVIPKKNIVETTITIDRSETLTLSSNTATTTYKPIKYDSESITNAAGTAQVRDTNYTINYMTGVVTEVSANMIDGSYPITYEQDPQRLDIGTLVANPIAIRRIEYPVGDQPPTYLGSFDVIEDYIILHKDTTLTEDKHLRIYYDSLWTAATATTDGEYPSHLDDAIIVGAAGQCLIFKAEEYVQSAVAELLLANAAVDSMATPLAAIDTALGKVTQYLEENIDGNGGGVDNTKAILTRITTDATQLRTRIDAILSKSNDFLFSADTDPSAKYYLTQGDAYIPTVNVADRVSEKFADYARASIQLFTGLVAEATMRLDVLRSYIEESNAWRGMGETFVAEAVQRINEANAWATQADRYALTSDRYMDIAGRYLASGQSKINEFFVMLGFKPEIQHSRAASSQATQY